MRWKKGGALKIYGDFNNLEAFKEKIKNAKEARSFANMELGQ